MSQAHKDLELLSASDLDLDTIEAMDGTALGAILGELYRTGHDAEGGRFLRGPDSHSSHSSFSSHSSWAG